MQDNIKIINIKNKYNIKIGGYEKMLNMKNYKKEFSPDKLSAKAFEIYSNSDFVFYEYNNKYYYADNSRETPIELGTIESVESFLIALS